MHKGTSEMITQLQNTILEKPSFTWSCPYLYVPVTKLQRQNSLIIFLCTTTTPKKPKSARIPLFSKIKKIRGTVSKGESLLSRGRNVDTMAHLEHTEQGAGERVGGEHCRIISAMGRISLQH